MAELAARAGSDGLGLPLSIGDARLAGAAASSLVAVLPFRGREAEVAAALGAGLPEPGGSAPLGEGRILWSGLGQWLLQGAPPPGLADLAAVVDQGDAWTALELGGAAAREVLARLIPIDLAPATLPPGRVARIPLRHVPCLLLATDDGFTMMVPRSFARTAVHDLDRAMRAVAGRAALGADRR